MVLFAGSAADRAVILEHEFYHTGKAAAAAALLGGGGGSGRGGKEVKFHVLLTSYETLRQVRVCVCVWWVGGWEEGGGGDRGGAILSSQGRAA